MCCTAFIRSPLPLRRPLRHHEARLRKLRKCPPITIVRQQFWRRGNVTFTGKSGAKIYVDGSFVGNIPVTIPLSAGRHKILVSDGKSADRQEYLTVMAGGSQTYAAAFSDRPVEMPAGSDHPAVSLIAIPSSPVRRRTSLNQTTFVAFPQYARMYFSARTD